MQHADKLLALLLVMPAQAFAWGATGHRLISSVGMQALPDHLPAFLKAPEANWMFGELGREADRAKGAGYSHDHDLGPGHYLNLDDAGLMGGAVPLASLPADRERYDTALRAKGLNEYQVGYLPYSLIEGWQQVRKDFAVNQRAILTTYQR